MAYSIAPILHNYADKHQLHAVQIKVAYRGMKEHAKTEIRITSKQWKEGKVTDHPHAQKFNALLTKTIHDIEGRLLEALREGELNKDQLREVVKGAKGKPHGLNFRDFAEKVKEDLNVGNGKNYQVLIDKVEDWRPGLRFSQIDTNLLQAFETYLKKDLGNGNNTTSKNMQTFLAILGRAVRAKLIAADAFADYSKPRYQQTLPVWLTEPEVESLSNLVKTLANNGHKQAGMYFLLSCFTGYRISDAKRFVYREMVQGDKVVLRAEKNRRIVSMPIHSRLKEVLAYCKTQTFDLSPEKARVYVKELCKLAGIKKDVKFHSARHTFAMLLMANGFTIDEVAELIGDTPLITQVYARVHNETLEQKIRERLG